MIVDVNTIVFCPFASTLLALAPSWIPSGRSHGGHGGHLLKAPVPPAVQPAVLPGVAASVFDDPFGPGVFAAPRGAHQGLGAFLGRARSFMEFWGSNMAGWKILELNGGF